MLRLPTKVWIVELTTASRLCAGLVFVCLAFQPVPRIILIGLYCTAIVTDVFDGYLARRLRVVTYLGRVLDLVSDKSLTMISLLYAAACGINLLPLALIGSREVIALGMRIIIVEGSQLLPTNRPLGGLRTLMVGGSTLLLISVERTTKLIHLVNMVYWGSAVFFTITFIYRIYSSFERIKVALKSDLSAE
jgi:phosphatidylglycerophosphate synthase